MAAIHKEIRETCTDDVFVPAADIVQSALTHHLQPRQPIEGLAQFDSLVCCTLSSIDGRKLTKSWEPILYVI